MTQSALAEMRTLLLELRPDTLVEADLPDLLRQLAAGLRSRASAPIDLELEGALQLPPDVHVTLYRVAQEALANATRHAGANRLRVTLHQSQGGATLRVLDDGIGFDPSHALPGHLGLVIMRERTRAIGADLDIVSRPGRAPRSAFAGPASSTRAAPHRRAAAHRKPEGSLARFRSSAGAIRSPRPVRGERARVRVCPPLRRWALGNSVGTPHPSPLPRRTLTIHHIMEPEG